MPAPQPSAPANAPAGFDPAMASIPAARNLVMSRVGDAPVDRDIVALLTSELVTNAIRHARTRFEVHVDRRDGVLRVSVTDGSPADPRPGWVPADAQSGRGMQFVAHYSSDWGVERDGPGKRVWFEVPVDGRPEG